MWPVRHSTVRSAPLADTQSEAMAVTVEFGHHMRGKFVAQSGAFEQTHQRSSDHAMAASEGYELDRRLTSPDQFVEVAL